MGFFSKIKFFLLKRKLKKNNKNILFGGASIIEFPEKLKSTGYVYVGPGALWSLKGGLNLGSNVIFGPKTSIWTYNHNYKSKKSIPYGGLDILKEVTVEDNCWIGFGVIILPGTRIGEGCVISAGSVVKGNIPPRSLISGNPGEIVKKLEKDNYFSLKEKGLFYLDIKQKRN